MVVVLVVVVVAVLTVILVLVILFAGVVVVTVVIRAMLYARAVIDTFIEVLTVGMRVDVLVIASGPLEEFR